MPDVKLSNIPSMNVQQLVELLTRACSAVVRQGQIPRLPSVMLWGPPGVGKSQAVRQLAERICAETGKKTHVTDVRLLLFHRTT